MTSIDDARLDEMLAAARDVRANAYVPYSGFHVGAAVLAGGELFTAVNVENASYPLSVCAERNAIAKAVAAGHTDIRAVAVVTDSPTPTPPCGGCRQVIAEFGNGIAVIAESADGSERVHWAIDELLPHAFGPSDFR